MINLCVICVIMAVLVSVHAGDKGDGGDKKPGIAACAWSHSDRCEEMHRTVAYAFEQIGRGART